MLFFLWVAVASSVPQQAAGEEAQVATLRSAAPPFLCALRERTSCVTCVCGPALRQHRSCGMFTFLSCCALPGSPVPFAAVYFVVSTVRVRRVRVATSAPPMPTSATPRGYTNGAHGDVGKHKCSGFPPSSVESTAIAPRCRPAPVLAPAGHGRRAARASCGRPNPTSQPPGPQTPDRSHRPSRQVHPLEKRAPRRATPQKAMEVSHGRLHTPPSPASLLIAPTPPHRSAAPAYVAATPVGFPPSATTCV